MNVYVARQPIFDRDNQVAGYELLYRNNGQAQQASGMSTDRMCTEMVANALLNIGLDRLTGGRPAFVNATRDFMTEGLFRLFPRHAVVIELLETVEPDAAAIDACAEMVDEGYQLALDDFEYTPQFDPLLRLAHIVKLDVLDRPLDQLRRSADRLRRFDVRLVAERVETEEVRAACARAGYELFQGYFFSRPETLTGGELPPNLTSAIRLLNLARDPRTTDRTLEEAVASDGSISYKLLRLASSAALGGGRNAASLGFAIRVLGRASLVRLAGLLAVAGSAREGSAGAELVRMSLVRARLCEVVAEATNRGSEADALFLVGLFSKIDALVRVPMADVVERIAFPTAVRDALLTGTGPYAPTLAVVDAYERGAWNEADELAVRVGIAPAHMTTLYAEALAWMRERMESMN